MDLARPVPDALRVQCPEHDDAVPGERCDGWQEYDGTCPARWRAYAQTRGGDRDPDVMMSEFGEELAGYLARQPEPEPVPAEASEQAVLPVRVSGGEPGTEAAGSAEEDHTGDGLRLVSDEGQTYWSGDLNEDILYADDPAAERERVRFLLDTGTLYRRDGAVFPEGAAKRRMSARILGLYDDLPPSTNPRPLDDVPGPDDEPRWLIPGLWPFGTIPIVGGNPKAGKTLLVADLAATLVVPDRKFLGRFGPVDSAVLADLIRARGVTVINGETPAAAFDHELWRAGITDPDSTCLVQTHHLEREGGAHLFDLTDGSNYRRWADRLIDCAECFGDDDWAPAAVIVDGLTAILAAAGRGPEMYGIWYAAFRRLMRELDVPNALVTGHNTMQGGHLMGGVEAQAGADGLWTYSATDPDNPASPRMFSVRPRVGGVAVPPTRVVVGQDGRLRALDETRRRPLGDVAADSGHVAPGGDDSADGEQAAGQPADGRTARPRAAAGAAARGRFSEAEVRAAVLAFVGRCNASGRGPSGNDLRREVAGRNPAIDAARKALVAEGLIEGVSGRNGGVAYWLTEAGRAANAATETSNNTEGENK